MKHMIWSILSIITNKIRFIIKDFLKTSFWIIKRSLKRAEFAVVPLKLSSTPLMKRLQFYYLYWPTRRPKPVISGSFFFESKISFAFRAASKIFFSLSICVVGLFCCTFELSSVPLKKTVIFGHQMRLQCSLRPVYYL